MRPASKNGGKSHEQNAQWTNALPLDTPQRTDKWHEQWKDLKEAKRAEDPAAYDAAYAEADEAYKLSVLVRELRTAAGISQTELARRAGTSQPAIARLEGGGSSPNLGSLRHIAAALDADLVVEFHSKAGVA